MAPDFLVIDIETVPVVQATSDMTEDERKKKINPIDSRVVAVGLMDAHGTKVFMHDDEATILRETWAAWKAFRLGNPGAPIVGFNHASFDIPFLVTRSFIVAFPFSQPERILAADQGETGKTKSFNRCLPEKIPRYG